MANNGDVILEVQNLVLSFKTDHGVLKAVRNISFDLHRGETLCIVGESGSGKSVTSKAILGILAANAIVEGGHIYYRGEDLLEVAEEEFHKIRGHKIGMIFQDPLSSLNPIARIGSQITEAMILKNRQKRRRSRKLFNNHLKELEKNIVLAYAKNGEDVKDKANKMCKEFDNFNIAGITLENSFNKSLTYLVVE